MNTANITNRFPVPIIIGFAIWLLILFNWMPFSVYAYRQVHILLLAAPLFLLPLCLHLSFYSKKKLWLILLAAILFALAYQLPKGVGGMLFVLPWLSLAIYETILCWRDRLAFTIERIVQMAAFVFWVVAASWALPDRLGYSPLDYDPLIILLTVVHFHYAGFILLQLFLLALPQWSKRLGKGIAILLLLGMPLVAVGISSTQVGLTTFIKSLSVTIMVPAGINVAMGYLYLGWKKQGTVFWMGLVFVWYLSLMWNVFSIVIWLAISPPICLVIYSLDVCGT